MRRCIPMFESTAKQLFFCMRKATALAMVSTLLYADVATAQDDATAPELVVTISCPEMEYRVGDEIPVTFTVTNVGDAPYKFSTRNYDRGGRMNEYQLTATTRNGDPLSDPRESWTGGMGGGMGGAKDLAKDESGAMTIALNRWCVITEAGQLTVQGTFSGNLHNHEAIVSPTINITVQPRSPQEMTDYISQLQSALQQMGPSVPQIPLTAVPPPGPCSRVQARGILEKKERSEIT